MSNYNAWQPPPGEDDSRWAYLRNYCSCPHCGIVWTHYETRRVKEDWQWAKKHYAWVMRCEACGQWSEAREHFFGGINRHRIPPPQSKPAPQPQTKTTKQSSKSPFWARTRKPRPVKERDHACEEER